MEGKMAEPWHKKTFGDRAAGAILLIAGAVLGYLGAVQPYLGMVAQEPSVSLSFKLAGTFPLLLGLGAVYAFFGKRAVALFGPLQAPKWSLAIFVVPLVFLGVAVYIVLSAQLKSHGYG
jgi:hypothetical protein